MQTSSSSAVRQLQDRLHQKGGGSAGSSHDGGGMRAALRSTARNKGAGARLTPLPDGHQPPLRARSRSRDGGAAAVAPRGRRLPHQQQQQSPMRTRDEPAGAANAEAATGPSPSLPSTSRSFVPAATGSSQQHGKASRFGNTHSQPSSLRNPSRDGGTGRDEEGDAKSSLFSNSTGGVRKPRKPPLATLGSHNGSSPTSTATTATGGGKMAPSRPSVRRVVTGHASPQQNQHQQQHPRCVSADQALTQGGGRRSSSSSQRRGTSDAADAPPPPAQANGGTARAQTGERKRTSEGAQQPLLLLPRSPHDMDSAFYKNPKNWNSDLAKPSHQDSEGSPQSTATAAAGRTVEKINFLLAGKQLEPAYASCLWAQCEQDPARALADHAELLASRDAGYCYGGAGEKRTDKAATETEQLLHVYKERLVNGYFCCVRCHTPICSPAFFWRAPSHDSQEDSVGSGAAAVASPTLGSGKRSNSHEGEQQQQQSSGYACFTHVHAQALRVELVVAPYPVPGSRAVAAAAPAVSSTRNPFTDSGTVINLAGGGEDREDEDMFKRSVAYGVRPAAVNTPSAVVFCVNCDGCLGAVSLQTRHSGGASGHAQHRRGSEEEEEEEAELFFANSMCLHYVAAESTQADMAGHLLLGSRRTTTTRHRDGEWWQGSGRGSTTAASSGGWMRTATDTHSGSVLLRTGALPIATRKTRACLVFQEAAPGFGEDGGEADPCAVGGARVVLVDKPLHDEHDDDDDDGADETAVVASSSSYHRGDPLADGGHLGAWRTPGAMPSQQQRPASAAGGGATVASDVSDSANDVEGMFDDLDDETLYL